MSTVGGGDVIQAIDHNDHESRLNAIEGRQTTTTATTGGSAISTTETAVDQVTKVLSSGETYRIQWVLAWGGSVNGDVFFLRLRLGSGIAGTQLQLRSVAVGSTFGDTITAYYTAPATGSQTFSATVVRNTGTGTLTPAGSSTIPRYLSVELMT